MEPEPHRSVAGSSDSLSYNCEDSDHSSSSESFGSWDDVFEHPEYDVVEHPHPHYQQQQQQRNEHPKEQQNSSMIDTSVWGEWDVPLGRNQQVREHIGNVRFRKLIDKHRPAYQQAGRKSDKTRIAFEIFSIIHSKQGRFLDKKKKSTDANGKQEWFEIEQDKALSKISQALRKGTRPTRKQIMAETLARQQQRMQQQLQQQAPQKPTEQQQEVPLTLENLAIAPSVISSLEL